LETADGDVPSVRAAALNEPASTALAKATNPGAWSRTFIEDSGAQVFSFLPTTEVPVDNLD
jgi:hypothetical protein